MPEANDFNAIRISLASPEQIKNWSYGEVTKPETINYRTLKPEKDGLFCERIFGPTKDFECYCGKYKRVRYKGIVCDRCGVEVARSKVRRERMAHIQLAAPVAHIWFAKGTPSRIGLLLDLSPRNLERVLYFAQYIVTSVDEERRQEIVEEIEADVASRRESLVEAIEASVAEIERNAESDLKELAEQRARIEGVVVKDREAAEAEAREDLERVRGIVQELAGKKAVRKIELFGEAIAKKGTPIDDEFIAGLDGRLEARLEQIKEEAAERQLNETEAIDNQIEARKEETDRQVNDVRRPGDEHSKSLDEELQEKLSAIGSVKERELLTESRFRELRDEYGEFFIAGMGAEAILDLMQKLDLDAFRDKLQGEIRSTSGQRRKKATKTIRVVEAFRKSGNSPEWMIMRVLPVLPPDLRPMVQLDGGRFATSDLNDLYRRTINRNNRLRRLLELGAPEIIIRNEKRMLQEAVDALIDNGRRGRAIEGSHNHRLKSLSDMLRGKQGRFRQNLLGKRVDYSGRSVIVVGPELALNQCGLPKKMALELFKPLVMHRLVALGLAHNIKSAKRMVERVRPEVWDVLEDVIRNRPVFLNRAPTLHRLGIQAFQPILIEGSAIQIHPLVCAAFNADFDGDQMAVHVPLSQAAVLEAKRLMLSTRNMLSPSSGEPLAAPTLDIVMGCYYLTQTRPGAKGEGRKISSPWDAKLLHDLGEIDLQAVIQVRGIRGKSDYTETTVGRIIMNEVAPEDSGIRFRNEIMDKRELKELVAESYQRLGNEGTAAVLDNIKALGFRYATQSGATIAINDIQVPGVKSEILEGADNEVQDLDKQYQRGLITDDERYRQTVDTWTKASESMEEAIQAHLPDYGSLDLMSSSGAKGNIAQIKQMAGMRGLMTDPRGRIIELPIRSSFREGLTVLEYFISTHGARKGLADTALRTADSGYLTRRLIDVSQDVIIKSEDCETDEGIWIMDRPDKPLMGKFEERIVGRYATTPVADPITGEVLVDRNEEIDEGLAELFTSQLQDFRVEAMKQLGVPEDDLSAADTWTEAVRYLTERKDMTTAEAEAAIGIEHHRVHVRSPLTCEERRGVCQLCYGRSLAKGEVAQEGEAMGIIAAQSIGEPGTQLTMRTFHTGGIAGIDITSGLPRVEELFEARAPKGQAIIAEIDGHLEVAQTEEGRRITVVHTEVYSDDHEVPKKYEVLIENDSIVEVGSKLARPKGASSEDEEGEDAEGAVTARIAGRAEVGKGVITISYEEREERSYAIPAAARIIVQDGDEVRAGDPLTSGPLNPQDILRVLGREEVEKYLVEEVQKVYRAQGVTINDKHIEIVVRQMLRKVRVETPGDTELLPEQILDRFAYQEVNDKMMAEGGEPATAVAVLLGVTKASLNTESFLAAASFQETTRVLTEAAVSGTVDRLQGPKENVIIGRLIPAQSKEVMAELAAPKEPPLTLLDPIGDGEGFEIALGDRSEEELAAMLEAAPGEAAPEAAPAGVVPEEQRIFEPEPDPVPTRIFEPEPDPEPRHYEPDDDEPIRPD